LNSDAARPVCQADGRGRDGRRGACGINFYQRRVLPHLVHASMRQSTFAPYRRKAAGGATGRVLEIGVGSGLNLPLYQSASHVIGLDPSAKLIAMARTSTRALDLPIELVEGLAEAIPLPDQSVDTVVSTWTLCSIPDVMRALGEMRRVLKPGGRLIFAEHGQSPDAGVMRWQNRLTPLWKRIAGGCHLNRPIERLIRDADFEIERIETGYMTGPKPMTFMYEGVARRVDRGPGTGEPRR
jgi:ubiquinone/menaquinone biosynthesis C-methylase UbiE